MDPAAVRRSASALRQARLRQVLARPMRLIPPRARALGLKEADPPGWRPLAAGVGMDPAPQSGPQRTPEFDGVFRAVGTERPFGTPGFWTGEQDGLLFLFTLHGFTSLAAYAAREGSDDADRFWSNVWSDWLATCASPEGSAWHPYPLSHRLLSWCSALSRGGWPRELERAACRSLMLQARFLRRAVEHDIGGNHVLVNAAALTVAGTCLGDRALARYGRRLLASETAEQVLPDGGHYERSPSYHLQMAHLMRDVATVLARAGSPNPSLAAVVERMDAWTATLTAPDGSLPLFNDAWDVPPARSLAEAAPITHLRDSGYIALRHDGDYAVLDVGELCPPHLPPHAHADALGFVLWAEGKPLVVDPGTFTYSGAERDRFRATRAHSTVEVDGEDQCRFWGPFRATDLPRVRVLRVDDRNDAVVVEAEHDGYRRLADPVIHRRLFCWLPAEGMVVVDRLLATRSHEVRTALPLAPGVSLDRGRLGPLRLTVLGSGADAVSASALHAPYLGKAEPTLAIRRECVAQPGTPFGWALTRTADVRLDGQRLTIGLAAGNLELDLS